MALSLHINPARVFGIRSEMIYGHFIEHFHRQIYDGVYCPGNPLSDEDGFRTDVMDAMKKNPVFRPYRVETGSVGQDYPRVFAEVAAPYTPDMVVAAMRANHVFVGTDAMRNAIYISPLNLTDEECVTVCNLLEEIRPGL